MGAFLLDQQELMQGVLPELDMNRVVLLVDASNK
jgi:hypothetical protein